jgi:hypothetical protein
MVWQGFGKRKFPRVEIDCEVYLDLINGNKKLKTQAKNIGVGGVCVNLKEQLRLFQEVEVRIFFLQKLNKLTEIICNGLVVWSVKTSVNDEKMYDVGIELLNLKKQDKDKIEDFIMSLNK